MIHRLHRISRVALLCLSVCQATAAINTITFFNSNQADLVSTDPFEFETAANSDADQVLGDTGAQAHGIVDSTWQVHEFLTRASARKSASVSKAVSMTADFLHEFDMRGLLEVGWRNSTSQLEASITFNDVVSLVARDPALPSLLSVTYFIKLTADRTHSIDIPPGQRPLYRLEDRIRFNANAGGLEFEPVEFDMTFYDIHTRPPITTEYSVLEDDVNIPEQQLIPDSQQIHMLQFDHYIVDQLAIWNGTLEEIELLTATSPVGPWQSAGTFTLQDQNPLVYALIEPEVLVLAESIQSRYLRIQVNSAHPYLPRETFEYAILRELALSVSPLADSEGAFLSLSMDGASLVVTWPAAAIGFQLQSATTLADGGDWRDIDEPPALQGDQHAVSVDRESAGTRFFRLHKP